MSTPRRRHACGAGLALVAAVAALGLAGCAGSLREVAAGDTEWQQRSLAEARVVELVKQMGDPRPDDINGWARAAAETAAGSGSDVYPSGIELIGIEARQSEQLIEPFGALTFRVPAADDPAVVGDPDGDDPAAYCFTVAFDYYGKAGGETPSDGINSIDCPPGAVSVTPPPDTTIRSVVSANTREAVTAVLLERLATGAPTTAAEVEAAISARLEQPAGQYEVAAEPHALVEGEGQSDGPGAEARVGVAVGTGDDCVLVKSENGAVADVYAPRVLLQAGELGCRPETALASDEELRPPH